MTAWCPRRGAGATALALALTAACGGKVPALPTTGGAPFPDAASAYNDATTQCRGVHTLSAELALSGRAGRQKLRGRILGGFAEPGKVRLEAPAPFGRPVFTLVVREGNATLVLERAHRVLRDAPPAQLVEALTGVALGPDELRAALSGCGLTIDAGGSGQSFPGDWVAIESGASRAWLRRVAGAWRLVAVRRDALEVRYDEFASGRPSVIHLRTTNSGETGTDLTLRVSQVDINVTLSNEAFQIDIPPDATPVTLEELRRTGPLGLGDTPPAAASAMSMPTPTWP